jgi:hypothetical protein
LVRRGLTSYLDEFGFPPCVCFSVRLILRRWTTQSFGRDCVNLPTVHLAPALLAFFPSHLVAPRHITNLWVTNWVTNWGINWGDCNPKTRKNKDFLLTILLYTQDVGGSSPSSPIVTAFHSGSYVEVERLLFSNALSIARSTRLCHSKMRRHGRCPRGEAYQGLRLSDPPYWSRATRKPRML